MKGVVILKRMIRAASHPADFKTKVVEHKYLEEDRETAVDAIKSFGGTESDLQFKDGYLYFETIKTYAPIYQYTFIIYLARGTNTKENFDGDLPHTVSLPISPEQEEILKKQLRKEAREISGKKNAWPLLLKEKNQLTGKYQLIDESIN